MAFLVDLNNATCDADNYLKEKPSKLLVNKLPDLFVTCVTMKKNLFSPRRYGPLYVYEVSGRNYKLCSDRIMSLDPEMKPAPESFVKNRVFTRDMLFTLPEGSCRFVCSIEHSEVWRLVGYWMLHGIGGELSDEKYEVGNGFVSVYIDDILISTESVDENERVLNVILDRLIKFNFCVKKEKCHLYFSCLKFLGIVVDGDGCRPDLSKLKGIRNLSPPTTVKELERYLGMLAFHSRFLVDHASLIAPLREVLSKHKGKGKSGRNLAISRESRCHVDHCCKIVNEALANCIALCHYNPSLPLKVYTDASDYGLAAALVQTDSDGNTYIVDVWSKLIDDSCRLLTIYKKELLAIRGALFRWRKFLMYTHFEVMVDNRSLVKHLVGSVQPNGVFEQRVVDEINEFAPDFYFIEGVNNPLADILSRASIAYPHARLNTVASINSVNRQTVIPDDTVKDRLHKNYSLFGICPHPQTSKN